MCQGIKKEKIFETFEQKTMYLSLINKYKDEFAVKLITYCVMDNHVHLLIFVQNLELLSDFMHKVNGTYGNYYNKEKERVGFVFRNRFKSEIVAVEKYIFNCIDYIHNNPVKAGICQQPSQYYHSGYNEFIGTPKIIDGFIAKQILGQCTYFEKQQENLLESINYMDIDKCADDVLKEIVKNFITYHETTLSKIKTNPQLLKELIYSLKIKNKIPLTCVERNLKINRKLLSSLLPKGDRPTAKKPCK